MNAGTLNKIITIQSKVETIDDYGGTVFDWVDHGTMWARVRPLRGRELVAAQAAQSEATVMFYIRYLSSVNSSMRIFYGGNYYDITAIIDLNDEHIEYEITAKTGVNEG